jgi:hypothetical protein
MMQQQIFPRLWSIVLAVLATIWVLEDISRQVAPEPSTICVAPLVYLLLLGNYCYCLVRAITSATGPQPVALRPRWRWMLLPAALALVMSALAIPWPMTIRFALSREAFERKVAEVLADDAEQGPQRIGLYWVKKIDVGPDDYVSFVTGASIIDPVGFAHDPKRPPSHPYNRHIAGNWYATEW